MPKKTTVAEEVARGYVDLSADEPIDDQAGFRRFVEEVMGLSWVDVYPFFDAIEPDGWRLIRCHVRHQSGGEYETVIYLNPPHIDRFLAGLDIPF